LALRAFRDIHSDITTVGGTMAKFLRATVSVLLLALAPLAARADTTVFAAASLSDALKQAGDAYKAKSGQRAVFSFAASSALARQIEASGGADIFISADRDWMDYLDGRGLIAHATRKDLLGNRLALIAPASSSVRIAIAPHFDLAGALGGGRLAVADPDSVPAGKYARTALTTLGVWNTVVDRLVQAENVRVALAYVARGEAPLGIVYTTDAMAEPKVRVVGIFPNDSHQPIVYPIALTKDARAEAKAFLDFLSGPEASAIFTKAGFIVRK
jgi:molybdate transport system substrate-binding protein